uniref:DNA ligase ATP-dependent C-terminal domain-containing protein n=1 Tax=Megaselia scalaris TaxID=36166 RepID=T1GPE8_MEGSC
MLSIFLMGCFDSRGKMWKTVTKVHSGLDDREMEDLQDELKDLMEQLG